MTTLDIDTTQKVAVGLSALLTVLFVGLKLGQVIDWPWLWVLSPPWLGLALVPRVGVPVLAGFGVVMGVLAIAMVSR